MSMVSCNAIYGTGSLPLGRPIIQLKDSALRRACTSCHISKRTSEFPPLSTGVVCRSCILLATTPTFSSLDKLDDESLVDDHLFPTGARMITTTRHRAV